MHSKIAFLVALTLACSALAGGCAAEAYFDPGSANGAEPRSADLDGTTPAYAAKTTAPNAPAPEPSSLVPNGATTPDAAQPAAVAREVVYSAGFRVVVADVPGAIAYIRDMAVKLGGYMQEVSGGTITVRVRATNFDQAVAFVEKVGEVVDRQLTAEDVTDQLHDLRTHLDNQEKLRQRYQELLAKADKVEDALKIEAELARVTEELDKTKGRLRYLESQVAMSTIRVSLNPAVPQNARGTGPRLPFDWVSDLGAGLVEGQMRQTVRQAGIFGRGPRFTPPTGFVRYYENAGEVEAMNAEGLRVRVVSRDNVDKAPQSFWSALVRKSLVEGRSLAVVGEDNASDYYLIRGVRDVGGKPLAYLACLKRTDRRVVVFEAWGPKEQVDPQFDTLRAAAVSIAP